MKTPITLLILVALVYPVLSFVSWDMNPAHWSAIARTVLVIVLILVSLKPIADRLNSVNTLSQTVDKREVSNTEFEQNQSVYKKALSMNVSGLTPEEREDIQATLAKADTLLEKLKTGSYKIS